MINKTSQTKRVRIAQILLSLTALLAVVAGVGAFASLGEVSKDVLVVETWRAIGFLTFAVLFGILAFRPTGNRALWITVILNKLALTIAGIVLMSQPEVLGASDLVYFDGGLTVVLVVASCFAGAWKK